MAPPWAAALALSLCLLAGPTLAAEPPQVVAARLGLGDAYKVGAWTPLRVTIEGGDAPLAVGVMALTPDSDGVGVATTAPGGRPISTEPGKRAEDLLYVRIGQQNAPVEVRLYADGQEVHRHTFSVGDGDPEKLAAGEELSFPAGATDRLVLQLGGDLTPGSEIDNSSPLDGVATSWPAVRDAQALPRDALGYDGFDTVLLVAGAAAGGPGGGWLGGLAPSDPRMRALVEWVENGGRLVVSCGAAGPTLLASGGALADLLPGKYDGPGTTSVAAGVERFADDAEAGAIDFTGKTLSISKLTAARGEVLASASGSGDDAPLVVRSPRGFGEVTFVAFDLDATAIAGWKGRQALVRRLVGVPDARPDDGNRLYRSWGESDVVNSLLAQLDSEFTGVRTAPFLAIVGLVVLYLLLIGPGDYFFVKHVLKKAEATWITFPLLVLATSAAAYAGAHWLKGDRLRVNSLEVIDIDTAAGRARGALVTHLFSPRAERYALRLAPRQLNGEPLEPEALSTAWLGKPGYGLGGMRSRGASGATGVRLGYQLQATPLVSAEEPEVIGMPVQVWSTKTLLSRYAGPTRSIVDAQLKPDRDGLVEGTLTNDTGARLVDCRLLYGSWAWKLGDLGDGETTTIDPSVSPLKITTLLAPIATPNEDYYRPIEGSVEALADALSVGSLASEGTARANRCLHGLDLGRQLASGRALLLARLDDGPRSELERPEGPLVPAENAAQPEGPARRSWVAVRFILPVEE